MEQDTFVEIIFGILATIIALLGYRHRDRIVLYFYPRSTSETDLHDHPGAGWSAFIRRHLHIWTSRIRHLVHANHGQPQYELEALDPDAHTQNNTASTPTTVNGHPDEETSPYDQHYLQDDPRIDRNASTALGRVIPLRSLAGIWSGTWGFASSFFRRHL